MSSGIDIKKKNLDLLNDIILGYSEYTTNFGKAYFKHLDASAYQDNISFYSESLKLVEEEGILSEKQQIENACSQGFWTKKKEEEIASITKSISRLRETKKKLMYKSDKKRIDEQIQEQNESLKRLEKEKRGFLVLTSEQVASKKLSDFYLKNFVFKDKKLSKKVFNSEEDFEYADDIYIEDITYYYYEFLDKTSQYNIKKVALSSDFQNIIFISDLPTEVFGKPIINLTRNQIDLLIWGKYFKNIIKNTTQDVPEGLMDDPDKFMEWIDGLKDKKDQKSKRTGKQNQTSSKFLFGSSDEIKSMTGQEISGNKILKEASEKGTLNMTELMDKQA